MTPIALAIYAIIIGIFEAIWRRSHGGGLVHRLYDKWIYPWLKINYRIPSVLVNSIVVFELMFGLRSMHWALALCVAGLIWLYWDYTFGMYMSIGRPFGRVITEDYEKEYAKAWFDCILRLIFPKNLWFSAWYDFVGMIIRFTFPVIPLCFFPTFTPWILTLGLAIPICYWLNIVLQEKFLKKFTWRQETAELMAGFVTGIALVIA